MAGEVTGPEILILLSQPEHAGVLADPLSRGRRVTVADSEQALDGRYDLGIVDGPTLHRVWRHIAERKRAESPAFLPFLLVTPPAEAALFARFLWTAVDELIYSPVQTPELLARVDVLLRAREASRRARPAEEERFRELFEGDPVGRWVAGPDGRISLCNPAFARLLGYPGPADLIQRSWADLVADPETGGRFLAALERGEVLPAYELELRRADGSVLPVLQSAAGRFRGGELIEVHGSSVDLSERRERERRAGFGLRLDAVRKLVGGLAHNFNNLLSTVVGYSELLLADFPSGDPRRNDVEEIRKAAQRSAELTRQLLAFARQQVLQPTRFDLNELVHALDRPLRTILGERIGIRYALDPAGVPVMADRGQLEQVLLNLALNARDAMAQILEGEVRVETERLVLEAPDRSRPGLEIPPGDYAVLRVHDQGRGIDPAVRARIFEPFFTTKPPGEGIGLGLATAYGIVKQSGGYIWLDSEPGRGTTATILLPLSRDPHARPTPDPGAAPAVEAGPETVLLVEDEESVRAMTGRILRQHGYAVLEAGSAEEALARLAEHKGALDLLVTDLNLPAMGGLDLAERVTELRPATRVLFVTGYSEQAVAALGTGAFPEPPAVLHKPFRAGELLGAVRKLLEAPPAPAASAAPPALDAP